MKKLILACVLSLFSLTAVAQDGPTTPVPPVPTEEMIREALWQRILRIDMEISASLADQRLYVYLLERVDPDGEHAALLRSRLAAERHRVLMLRLEREGLLFDLFGK
jgi:hypothetical protein